MHQSCRPVPGQILTVFAAKGDSGSLVWHTRGGKAYIIGQLHSGENKGGPTSNHIISKNAKTIYGYI
jgi:hypothetical protein